MDKSKDYVFVRYDEELREYKVPFASVEKKLNCMRLVREKYESKNDVKVVGIEYAICPLEAV